MHADAAPQPTIVVGVDGSPSSQDALRWAATQAVLTQAKLLVVATWEFPTSFGWAPPYPPDFDPEGDTREALTQTVRSVLGEDRAAELEITVVEGHPAPTLVGLSARADLLVVGSRGHGAFAGMLLGSVSEHCASHASCPVVVVRHGDVPS